MPTKRGFETPEEQSASQRQKELEKEAADRARRERRQKTSGVIDNVLDEYVGTVGGEVRSSSSSGWSAPGTQVYFRDDHLVVVKVEGDNPDVQNIKQIAAAVHKESGASVAIEQDEKSSNASGFYETKTRRLGTHGL